MITKSLIQQVVGAVEGYIHCTPIHTPCEKGNFAIVISITWYNRLIINKIRVL